LRQEKLNTIDTPITAERRKLMAQKLTRGEVAERLKTEFAQVLPTWDEAFERVSQLTINYG
jgi:hypothetical protein